MKRILVFVFVVMMIVSVTACGGSTPSSSTATTPAASQKTFKTGTIMYMSNISSGPAYNSATSYLKSVYKEFGYDVVVVYGDANNDPASNLKVIKNAMTDKVVGLIACQDGGISEIMKEYPDLWVVGYNTDMASVYTQGGASAAAKTNPHFLGAICDGDVSGVDRGHKYSKVVIDKGYHKVSIIVFPAFAYPQLTVASKTFRADIDAFNKTASDDKQITVVGNTTTLMFKPVDASYFMDANIKSIDAIVAFCAGTTFVYPTLKSAIAAGTVNKDMKLLTGGFENDKDTLADVGGKGVIQMITFSPSEDLVYPLVMLDNAIQGNQFKDWTASEAINGAIYTITTQEQVQNVVNKSMAADANISKTVAPVKVIQNLFTRNNPNATYKALKDFIASERLTVDFLAK